LRPFNGIVIEVGGEVGRVVDVGLLDESREAQSPVPPRGVLAADGQQAVDVVIVLHPQAKLFQVVDALAPPGRLASRLYGGQQQGDQDGDDRDHHQ
jgi:hypothetical protein